MHKQILHCVFVLCIYLLASVTPAQAQNYGFNLRSHYVPGHTSSEEMSNLWGYSVAGREYVILGTTAGVSIIDITDPDNPDEVFFVSGPTTSWREPKVYGNYAYITNEHSGGLQIINLSPLPNGTITNANVSYWTGGVFNSNNITFTTSHTPFIDENGIIYINGANYGAEGCIMANLAANPTNPPIVGIYNTEYVHDCYARNDTLWLAEIYNGTLTALDVSNKANPVLLGSITTTGAFTHNVWLSETGPYAFTTDEENGATVDAYDISDVSDMQLVGRYTPQLSGAIPHNVYVRGNFGVLSAYTDGVTVFDLTHPQKMIEVANYDTSPNYSGGGFNGCWGVYTFFASGTVIASDMEEGLYVFSPTYLPACFIQGNVTDGSNGNTIQGVTITVTQNTAANTNTDFSGTYLTGTATAGSYTITFAKSGYISQTITVNLTNGNTITQNIVLQPNTPFTLTGQVVTATTLQPIAGAELIFDNGLDTYTTTASGTGSYSINLPGPGSYDVTIGKWGYRTLFFDNITLTTANNGSVAQLQVGYYDDFSFNFGWQTTSTAMNGQWVRDIPFGTTYNSAAVNPSADISSDYGNMCYITANPADGNPGAGDVDGGTVTLTSPIFNLNTYGQPRLTYYRWFMNGGGNTTPDDQMIVKLTNGITTITLETVANNDPYESQWKRVDVNIGDLLFPTANMQLIVEVSDLNNAHLVEGGIDGFEVTDLSPFVTIPMRGYLEGAYQPAIGTMRTSLNTSPSLLPALQPYSVAPWSYSGKEATSATPTGVVDWVLIEVRNASNPEQIVEQRAAYILSNGTIRGLQNANGVSFTNVVSGNSYYFTLRHRNHLDIITQSAMTASSTNTIDFSVAANIAGGAAQLANLGNGRYGLRAGDINGDGVITVADYNIYIAQSSFLEQYLSSDVSLDRSTTVGDFNLYLPNSSSIGNSLIRY